MYTNKKKTSNTCKSLFPFLAPKSFLLFSQKNEIRRLVVSDKSVSAEPDMVLPLKGLSKLEALDFDPTTGFVYWIVGGGTGKSKPAGSKPKPVMIKRAKLDGTLVICVTKILVESLTLSLLTNLGKNSTFFKIEV